MSSAVIGSNPLIFSERETERSLDIEMVTGGRVGVSSATTTNINANGTQTQYRGLKPKPKKPNPDLLLNPLIYKSE